MVLLGPAAASNSVMLDRSLTASIPPRIASADRRPGPAEHRLGRCRSAAARAPDAPDRPAPRPGRRSHSAAPSRYARARRSAERRTTSSGWSWRPPRVRASARSITPSCAATKRSRSGHAQAATAAQLDLALVLAIPIMHPRRADVDHHHARRVDALFEPAVEPLGPMLVEPRLVADHVGLAFDRDEERPHPEQPGLALKGQRDARDRGRYRRPSATNPR